MLKIYNTLDEVPEALREHYAKVDGKYVPQLSDDHPVLTHNKKLLSEKSEATAKVAEIQADLDQAKQHSVPRGHVAVAKADSDLLDKYKALGKTPEELTAIQTEHGTMKQDTEKRAREDNLRLVAKELNYQPEAFILLPNLPEFEIRDGKDGKKQVIAKPRDDKGVVTEKLATEFIESSPTIAPLLPALKTTEGVRVHTSPAGVGTESTDPFAWAREYGKQHNEASKPAGDIFESFNIRKSA